MCKAPATVILYRRQSFPKDSEMLTFQLYQYLIRLYHRDHHYCQPVLLPPQPFAEILVELMVNEMVNQNLWAACRRHRCSAASISKHALKSFCISCAFHHLWQGVLVIDSSPQSVKTWIFHQFASSTHKGRQLMKTSSSSKSLYYVTFQQKWSFKWHCITIVKML